MIDLCLGSAGSTDKDIAITVTYVPYAAIEIPSNLFLKKIGPKLVLPSLCVTWGFISLMQFKVNNFGGFVAARFFLGLAEGGLLPGAILYLSLFYRRSELQFRIAFFFCGVSLAGAFSGLLAAAIQQMDGAGGLHGWQWIFILEGLVTVVVGASAFFILPNTPADVRKFTPEEKQRCLQRLQLDSNDFTTERVTLKAVLSVFKDPHIMLTLPTFLVTAAMGFGLSVFGPSIVRTLGYSPTITQLLIVPPFVMAFVLTLLVAMYSDKYGARGLTAFATGLFCIPGIIMMYKGRGFGVRYAGICIFIAGAFPNGPCLLSWMPNNTAGYARRATAVALTVMFTSIGGIVSTWLYPTSTAPYYEMGAYVNISLICLMLSLIGFLSFWYRRENGIKRDHPERLLRGVDHLDEEEQFRLLGDHHPKFKYVY